MVAVVSLVEAMNKRGILIRLIVGACGNLVCKSLNISLYAQHLVEGLGGLVNECCCVGNTHLLRQIAYCALAIDANSALGGLLLASDDA